MVGIIGDDLETPGCCVRSPGSFIYRKLRNTCTVGEQHGMLGVAKWSPHGQYYAHSPGDR